MKFIFFNLWILSTELMLSLKQKAVVIAEICCMQGQRPLWRWRQLALSCTLLYFSIVTAPYPELTHLKPMRHQSPWGMDVKKNVDPKNKNVKNAIFIKK